MTIDADDFQALARSSPWLWTAMEYDWNGGAHGWLQRPARAVVVEYGELVRYEERADSGRSFFGRFGDGAPWRGASPKFHFISQGEVERRQDGLVEQRPDDLLLSAPSQPLIDGYLSVAAFDPVELATDVTLADLRVEQLRGRETWVARCRPGADYEPRCGCCALLPNPALAALEWGEERAATMEFPSSVEVWLDRQTGIVTRWLPDGGASPPRETEILGVDDEVDFAAVWQRAKPAP